jgi:hypothetical protein
MTLRLALPLALLVFLPGCLAKAALDVVTAPVRVASKAVDLATTSQSEADEKRGRELRKREERLGKLERAYARNRRECDEGERHACKEARDNQAEIDDLMATMPSDYRY